MKIPQVFLLTLLLCFCCSFCSEDLPLNEQTPPTSPTDECIIIYSECGFKGEAIKHCEKKEVPTEKIRSIYIPENLRTSLRIPNPYYKSDLSKSLVFHKTTECIDPIVWEKPQCITIYSECGFKGEVFEQCEKKSVPTEKIRSIYIPENLRTSQLRIANPYYKNDLSKQLVFRKTTECIDPIVWEKPQCITIYSECNFSGEIFELCQKMSVPTEKIRSVYIPQSLKTSLRIPNPYDKSKSVVFKKTTQCIAPIVWENIVEEKLNQLGTETKPQP